MLTDGVVTLRPWAPEDREQRFAAYADPLVQRFAWPLTRPFEDADLDRVPTDDELVLAILDQDGTVLGGAGLYDITPAGASVGYWLGPAARGRGNATRAVELLAAHAFGNLGVQRLELTCGADNAASARVAERAGFAQQRELVMQFRGRPRPSLLYARDRC